MDSDTRLRTLKVTSRNREAIKPAELIQVTGHHDLTLNARRAITILWYHAHAQGVIARVAPVARSVIAGTYALCLVNDSAQPPAKNAVLLKGVR
jgi:hypothetical protein